MQTKTKRILLSASLAFCCSVVGWAQDVFVDFVKEGTANSRQQTLTKGGNVDFEFVGSGYEPFGAYFYKTSDTYHLTISAPRTIAVIEYQITQKSGYTSDLRASTGTISTKDAETRVWRGLASTIKFVGGSESTNFRITRLRFWYNETDYNPDVSWDAAENTKNPYEANVNLAEDDTDYSQKDRVYASANVLPHDGHGIPMAVVSARKFQQTLQPYLEWKTQQGYEVQELYTDQIPGKSGNDLAYAIREKLMAMKPRPAYVLLVGDVDEVPSFPGSGPADLYYGEYTDDYYPEAYVGRFSANTIDQLQPQLDKTKYMAFITPQDGEWLKRSLTIDDITPEISVMNPASDLSLYYPRNFEGNTSQKTETTWSESINTIINNGCSYVSYFGHGGPGMWNGNYSNSNVNSLTNSGKYPVVFSITCHAGNFAYEQQPCLAEAFMQRQNAGAVAVIAASRPSRCDSNYRLFFGDHTGDKTSSVGLLRSLFPCVGVEPSQRARTIGQALEIGMLAVARRVRDDFVVNTEMYNLLGDPTYQPYITIPKTNKLQASSNYITTGRNVTVNTVPDAMVCLSQGRKVIAAAMADAEGKVVLHVPATAPTGDCTLYTSAPGYNDLSRIVTLTAGNGTEEIAEEAAALANITQTDVISLETAGSVLSSQWNTPQPFSSTTSSACYLICAVNDKSSYANEVTGNSHWLNSDASAEGIFMRNHHAPCSIVTTSSAGTARRVGIEWLHPAGQGEVIGVYGSNTPYNNTNEAWNGSDWNGSAKGDKLGDLVKGCNDELIIKGDYKYLLFRAEPHKQFPTAEQSNVYFKSLSIGWETTLPQCAKPQIAFEDGKFRFGCSTPNATYNYGVAPAQGEEDKFVLTVTAEADGFKPSEAATLTIDASQLSKISGDIDENGSISIADVVKLINTLNTKK